MVFKVVVFVNKDTTPSSSPLCSCDFFLLVFTTLLLRLLAPVNDQLQFILLLHIHLFIHTTSCSYKQPATFFLLLHITMLHRRPLVSIIIQPKSGSSFSVSLTILYSLGCVSNVCYSTKKSFHPFPLL